MTLDTSAPTANDDAAALNRIRANGRARSKRHRKRLKERGLATVSVVVPFDAIGRIKAAAGKLCAAHKRRVKENI